MRVYLDRRRDSSENPVELEIRTSDTNFKSLINTQRFWRSPWLECIGPWETVFAMERHEGLS